MERFSQIVRKHEEAAQLNRDKLRRFASIVRSGSTADALAVADNMVTQIERTKENLDKHEQAWLQRPMTHEMANIVYASRLVQLRIPFAVARESIFIIYAFIPRLAGDTTAYAKVCEDEGYAINTRISELNGLIEENSNLTRSTNAPEQNVFIRNTIAFLRATFQQFQHLFQNIASNIRENAPKPPKDAEGFVQRARDREDGPQASGAFQPNANPRTAEVILAEAMRRPPAPEAYPLPPPGVDNKTMLNDRFQEANYHLLRSTAILRHVLSQHVRNTYTHIEVGLRMSQALYPIVQAKRSIEVISELVPFFQRLYPTWEIPSNASNLLNETAQRLSDAEQTLRSSVRQVVGNTPYSILHDPGTVIDTFNRNLLELIQMLEHAERVADYLAGPREVMAMGLDDDAVAAASPRLVAARRQRNTNFDIDSAASFKGAGTFEPDPNSIPDWTWTKNDEKEVSKTFSIAPTAKIQDKATRVEYLIDSSPPGSAKQKYFQQFLSYLDLLLSRRGVPVPVRRAPAAPQASGFFSDLLDVVKDVTAPIANVASTVLNASGNFTSASRSPWLRPDALSAQLQQLEGPFWQPTPALQREQTRLFKFYV